MSFETQRRCFHMHGGGGLGMRLQGTKSHTQTTHYDVCLVPRSSCTRDKKVASFSNLACFVLRFAFSVYVIHKSTRMTKNGKGLVLFITWMMSGERKVDLGEGTTTLDKLLEWCTGLRIFTCLKLLNLTGKKYIFKLVCSLGTRLYSLG